MDLLRNKRQIFNIIAFNIVVFECWNDRNYAVANQ